MDSSAPQASLLPYAKARNFHHFVQHEYSWRNFAQLKIVYCLLEADIRTEKKT